MQPWYLGDLARQSRAFEASGGFREPHNRKAGAAKAKHAIGKRASRRRQRQFLRQLVDI